MKKQILMATVWLVSLFLAGCNALGGTAATPAPGVATQGVVLSGSTGLSAEGHIVPRDFAWLSFNREGKVSEVLVKDGQKVKAGEPLARLGNREPVEASVKAAELQVLSSQQALDNLNRMAGSINGQAWLAVIAAQNKVIEAQQKADSLNTRAMRDKIDTAWTKAVDARNALDDEQKNYDKYKNLDLNNANRIKAENALDKARNTYNDTVVEHNRLKSDVENAQAALTYAQAAKTEAQRRYEAGKNGPDPDQLALAKANLTQAQAQLAAAQSALKDLDLLAPYDGTVVQVNISAGVRVMPTQMVLQIADLSTLYVETSDLTELEVVKIDLNKAVVIVPDALTELKLNGKIELVRDNYAMKSGDVVYTVRIRLDKPDERLRWGMTVKVEFGRN